MCFSISHFSSSSIFTSSEDRAEEEEKSVKIGGLSLLSLLSTTFEDCFFEAAAIKLSNNGFIVSLIEIENDGFVFSEFGVGINFGKIGVVEIVDDGIVEGVEEGIFEEEDVFGRRTIGFLYEKTGIIGGADFFGNAASGVTGFFSNDGRSRVKAAAAAAFD
jgi:hypothetical protein